MTVKFEIKDQLAKLLATEDLVVEHKKVLTASFNVSTRVLVLPMWEKASNNVYDMLVGHEVGHALFTPNVDIASFKAPSSYINVIEDARIEKRKAKDFLHGAKCRYISKGSRLKGFSYDRGSVDWLTKNRDFQSDQ